MVHVEEFASLTCGVPQIRSWRALYAIELDPVGGFCHGCVYITSVVPTGCGGWMRGNKPGGSQEDHGKYYV